MQYLVRATVIAICLISIAVWIHTNRFSSLPIIEQVAHSRVGDQWYKIEQSGVHTGFMHSSVKLNKQDQWVFRTLTVFQPMGGLPTKITQNLTFSNSEQYELQTARYSHTSKNRLTDIQLALDQGKYIGTLKRQDTSEALALDWRFHLTDQLALEAQIFAAKPQSGSVFTSTFIDFENLAIGENKRKLLARNSNGFTFENFHEGSASTTHLDTNMQVVSSTISNVFQVNRSTKKQATLVNPSIEPLADWQLSQHSIPLDKRLEKHGNLNQLTLGLVSHGRTSLAELNLPLSLAHTKPDSFANLDKEKFTRNTASLPLANEKITRILQTLDKPISVAALVDTTNQQLRYINNRPAGSVLAALEAGQGECTDFADLFTTLARSAGIPARTVYGIAYSSAGKPSFMFHAWNEVFAEGQWQGVDPTWNQVRLDATHIKLSDDLSAALLLASSTNEISFTVLDQSYF